MKHLEIYTHEYEGVNVIVKINYDNETISLQEKADGARGYTDKKWVFAGRTMEYMAGWRNICEAIIDATKTAEVKLKIFKEQKANKLADAIIAFSGYDVLEKEVKPYKKSKK